MSDHLIPNILSVKYLGAHRLRLRFDNGAEGEVDLFPRLTFTGVFVPLRDPEYFARVRVDSDSGTICWPNDVDLDPLVLHSWVTGIPIPDFGVDASAEDP